MIAPARWSDVSDLVSPEDFYRPDHGALFELLKKMLSGEDKDTVELMTVVDRVRREGRAERYGASRTLRIYRMKCPVTRTWHIMPVW
jgi:replicative DNA helicase